MSCQNKDSRALYTQELSVDWIEIRPVAVQNTGGAAFLEGSLGNLQGDTKHCNPEHLY
jgi:hypothetical protein